MLRLITVVLFLSVVHATPSLAYCNYDPATTAPGTGLVAGKPINNGSPGSINGLLFWSYDSKLSGFTCYHPFATSPGKWYPKVLFQKNSLGPNTDSVDMAYADAGTSTWSNVQVPAAGVYTLKVRYSLGPGAFPNLFDRPEAILINGIKVVNTMHFWRTQDATISGTSPATFCHSSIYVQMPAGISVIQMNNNGLYSGVSRVDDMVISPAPPGTVPTGLDGGPVPNKAVECNQLP